MSSRRSPSGELQSKFRYVTSEVEQTLEIDSRKMTSITSWDDEFRSVLVCLFWSLSLWRSLEFASRREATTCVAC